MCRFFTGFLRAFGIIWTGVLRSSSMMARAAADLKTGLSMAWLEAWLEAWLSLEAMDADLLGDISGLRLSPRSSRLAPNKRSWAERLLPEREGGREEVDMSPIRKFGLEDRDCEVVGSE